MKYKVIVKKQRRDTYLAVCPVIGNAQAYGISADAALAKLQEHMFCYLHDAEAELEIVMAGEGDALSQLMSRDLPGEAEP
ncbi:MAG: hypothetical protein A2219_00885 [Elusimicrobia bacterium RIFOXYA2_FULL_50_26]|nr:MAG: hypothetical protein A2219_00885 [Elusimicrobia bacterium RIFOXYA2_FULL_50_26]OGS24226.1 MAG: hypothetical protein A2314_00955 [Elusimicrobia bacterium RIFOXYB2_FULL_50_12]